jgi:hypothetical protein
MGLFKRKFKVGDQVEIINTEIFGASVNLGDEATVEIVYDKDDFLIKFKDGRTQCIFVDPHHYVKLVDTPFKCFLNLFRKGEK